MFKHSFSPPDFKQATSGLPIKAMGPVAEVILPLLQHTGAAAEAQVAVGDKVKVGSLIAAAKGNISAAVHASVSGEVKAIAKKPHPVLGEYPAIVIASDGQDTLDPSIQPREKPESLSADQLRQIIRQAGIVGLGGAGFPTHVKLNPPQEKPIDAFILNGAECEPYLSADHRLMLEQADQILTASKIAMNILGVKTGYVAVEENKPDVIELYQRLLAGTTIKVVALKSFYPQGAEKQLIKTVLGREVPPGKLPFDVGTVVQNVATCFAIYQAVYQNKPLYQRVITLTGKIIRQPANLLVRVGTKAQDLIDFCGGFSEDAGKVILGGPMMGIAQYTLEVPVIKGTSGIIAFSQQEAKTARRHPCIRCGRCLQICPMGLNPSALAQAIEKGRFDLAEQEHVFDCVECGICSYVCPGNSKVVGLVKLAKQKLTQIKKDGKS